MVKFTGKGDFSKTDKYLKRVLKLDLSTLLTRYAEKGVKALEAATPSDTGLTAASWSYEIEKTNTYVKIVWTNSNFNKGVPIAVLIQYGHGTGTGGYVTGIDYINPAMKPIFDEIEEGIMKEVNAE